MDKKVTCRCSFCGKGDPDVWRMIVAAHGVCICDQCVEECAKLISPYPPRPGRRRRLPMGPFGISPRG